MADSQGNRQQISSKANAMACEQAKLSFLRFDLNGDGQITQEEMKTLFGTLGNPISAQKIEAMFREVDDNGDGSVDMDDFFDWVFGEKKTTDWKSIREVLGRAMHTKDIPLVRATLQQYAHANPLNTAEVCESACTDIQQFVMTMGETMMAHAGLNVEPAKCPPGVGGCIDQNIKNILVELFSLLDGNRDGKLDFTEGLLVFLANPAEPSNLVGAREQFVEKFKDCGGQPTLDQFVNQFAQNLPADVDTPTIIAVLGDMVRAAKEYCAGGVVDLLSVVVDMIFRIKPHSPPSYQAIVDGVFEFYIFFSLHAGLRRAKFALIQAERLGMTSAKLKDLKGKTKAKLVEAQEMPKYWDVNLLKYMEGGKGLEADGIDNSNLHATAALTHAELQEFQQLFDATFQKVYTRDRRGESVPDRLEVIEGWRVMNLRNWAEHVEKKNQMYTALNMFKSKGVPFKDTGCTPVTESQGGKAVDIEEPMTAGHLSRYQLGTEWRSNCHWFFHGTSKEAAQFITQGDFLVSLAGSNAGTLYGNGIYLAESCSKSDEYCSETEEGIRTILVCRGALGHVLYEDRVNPDVDDLVQKCTQGVWHSVLGDRKKCRGTFREFIVYDNDQVYPEFIIYYRRVCKPEAPLQKGQMKITGKSKRIDGIYELAEDIRVHDYPTWRKKEASGKCLVIYTSKQGKWHLVDEDNVEKNKNWIQTSEKHEGKPPYQMVWGKWCDGVHQLIPGLVVTPPP